MTRSRKKYVKAMLKAIDAARSESSGPKRKFSKTDGLRVIKRFEKVNNIAFDPFNIHHVDIVSGWGWNESMLRSLKKFFKNYPFLEGAEGESR